MKRTRRMTILGTVAAAVVSAAVLTPQVAMASDANCITSDNVCWWNNTDRSGGPNGIYGRVPGDQQNWNITDNTLSSAISRYQVGAYRWQITNSEGLTNRAIANLQKGVGISLAGNKYNNVADDMYFVIP